MADGEMILTLDPETSRMLQDAADAAGLQPVDLVAQMVADVHLDIPDEVALGIVDPDPAIDRAILDEFQRTRMGVPWEEVEAWMQSWFTDNPLPRPKVRKL